VAFATVDASLDSRLHAIPGVLEHGIFLRIAQAAIIGGPSGIRVLGKLG